MKKRTIFNIENGSFSFNKSHPEKYILANIQ